MVSALLLDRSVLLVAEEYTLLTVCGECLQALLLPLVWTHMAIPALPSHLIHLVTSPTPSLLGLQRSLFTPALAGELVGPLIVDLNANRITLWEPIPLFPGAAALERPPPWHVRRRHRRRRGRCV